MLNLSMFPLLDCEPLLKPSYQILGVLLEPTLNFNTHDSSISSKLLNHCLLMF
jgi:hypothetical protein